MTDASTEIRPLARVALWLVPAFAIALYFASRASGSSEALAFTAAPPFGVLAGGPPSQWV